ncbi:hypothetical protein DAPPUDRAFT_248432 [Daphnia pulex]|uniref:Uncharacterized protein n=1 Tax=Daphnia pulex TaxID=6669 RepID=E9GUN3_DAPPU|nr:hypothetical protein DAPPUDRAFT_248432 [Daphnia pulex]|eukprot:EFX76760.1 hypothetical protein DAPPUDRAFT_248432 [Daphnia pulex]
MNIKNKLIANQDSNLLNCPKPVALWLKAKIFVYNSSLLPIFKEKESARPRCGGLLQKDQCLEPATSTKKSKVPAPVTPTSVTSNTVMARDLSGWREQRWIYSESTNELPT